MLQEIGNISAIEPHGTKLYNEPKIDLESDPSWVFTLTLEHNKIRLKKGNAVDL